jgi:hypothetical protein
MFWFFLLDARYFNAERFTSEVTSELFYNLKNGEKIIVEADVDEEHYKTQGYIFEDIKKEYVVDTFSYAKDFEEIPEEKLEEIIEHSNDMIKARLAKPNALRIHHNEDDYAPQDNGEIKDIKLENAFFLTNKSINERNVDMGDKRNRLYLCYSFDISNIDAYSWDDEFPTEYEDVYIYTFISNLVIDTNGDLTFDIDDIKISERNVYTEKEELVDLIAISNLDVYEYEEVNAENFTDNIDL